LPEEVDMAKKTVIIGTVGTGDPHFIATFFLGRVLNDAGFKVVNLGCNCGVEEFIKAAIETKADAILMSSLLGYAESDLKGYKDMLQEAGLKGIVSYIGGNLSIGVRTAEEAKIRFQELGFKRAYPGVTDFEHVVRDLKEDLNLERG
jgi:methylaspartate mutase sigma subunit